MSETESNVADGWLSVEGRIQGTDYSGLPSGLQHGARMWLQFGVQPGSFLSAVIANNLREAVARADHENIHKLRQIVSWFYNYVPAQCWGSDQKAEFWAAYKGREWENV